MNSRISTSVLGGPNYPGGNIILIRPWSRCRTSQVPRASGGGAGGIICIIAGTFLADQTSAVSASSEFGLNGTVPSNRRSQFERDACDAPAKHPAKTQQLVTQRCAAQGNGHLSSLVVAGRDMLPVEPGGWLMSPLSVFAVGCP